MKNRWLYLLAVGVAILLPTAALADTGFIRGNAANPLTCDDTITADQSSANVYGFDGRGIADGGKVQCKVKNGTQQCRAKLVNFTPGTWSINPANFFPSGTAADLKWIVATTRDAAGVGYVAIDQKTAALGHRQVFQPVTTTPLATPGAMDSNGNGTYDAGEPPTGFDLRFTPPQEFDKDPADVPPTGGATQPCFKGWLGTATTAAFQHRVIGGYNIYRTAGGPPTTANWIGYVNLNTGIDLDGAGGGTDLNADNDLAGVEGGALIYSDAAHLPRQAAANPTAPPNFTGPFTYFVQPVVKTTAGLAGFNSADPNVCPCTSGGNPACLVQDGDGDANLEAVDLTCDGIPEFIDPSGNGLGLTYQDATQAYLLLSAGVATTGASLPAEGTITFNGSFAGGNFNLNFTSTLAGVAGFNVYRSIRPEGGSSYTRVNKSLILADNTPLFNYGFKDAVAQASRMARGVYFYKVEAVLLDGSTVTYGPFAVEFAGTTAPRSR